MRLAWLALALLLLVPACAHCLTEADVSRIERDVGEGNARRMQQAIADGLRAHDLTDGGELTGAQVDASTVRLHSTEPAAAPASESLGEPIAEDGTAGETVLVVPSPCGGGCECHIATGYHLGRDAAGHAVVIRLHVQQRTRAVHVCGACGYGCGVPMPEQPPSVYALPGGFGGFVDVDVVQEDVSVGCDHPIPRP